ncbi:MAG: hypothetical protein JOZ22_19605, partial [Acidobacteriia bacterium]|nr:hypothetical protein [Terriglobia bacterium]
MLIAILSPGLLNPSLALAATRAGELAVLDFEYVRDPVAITSTLERYNQVAQAPFGIKLDADTPQLLSHILANSTTYAGTVFLASACPLDLQVQISQLHNRNITAVLEVNCLEQAKAGQAVGAD